MSPAVDKLVTADDSNLADALRQAREELQRQESFLAIVTHELRNPLGPVLMSLDALQIEVATTHLDRETLARRLAMMRRYVERLRSDLDRLLDFSRMRSGHIDLELEDVDLSVIVADTVRGLRPLLDASACDVSVELAQPLVGHWDRMRIGQIAFNLISNAAKYAAGARIEITTSGDAGTATLKVRDHGPGIPPDQQEIVFRKFERAAAGLHTGFGIGLWLVKRIVDALGGTLLLDSAVDVGTTFTVTLPRTR